MKKLNKLFTLLVLSIITTTSFAFTPIKNGKVVMIISIEVKNYSDWKKGFDAGAPVREKAGIKVVSVCTSLENENQVVVIEEAENAQSAQNFLEVLKSKQKSGDILKLDVKVYNVEN